MNNILVKYSIGSESNYSKNLLHSQKIATKNNTMKKLLLLLLIAPIIGNSQIGNIFPTDIKEIISIADGEFYHIPEGYVFQPMIGKESSLSVFATNFITLMILILFTFLILTEREDL